MEITKQQALDMLDKVGPRDLMPASPLAHFGPWRGQLIERFGASP